MFQSVPEFLLKTAELFPEKEAVRDALGKSSYSELAMQSLKIAGGLIEAGLKHKEKCLIILPNSISFLRAHFGVILAGGWSVPCESQIQSQTLSNILLDAKPHFIILDNKSFIRLRDYIPKNIKILITDLTKENTNTSIFSEIDWLSNAKAQKRDLKTTDVFTVMYTTGSTGTPKGILLTHQNIVRVIESICNFIHYTSEDKEVITLPISHSFGLGHVYCNLRSGASVLLENGLTKVGRVLNSLETFSATGFPGTPLGYSFLLERYSEILQEKGKNLRFIVINSAPLPPERAHKIRSLLPQVNLLVYYGLTEASRATMISLTKEGPQYYGSVGKPMSHNEIQISHHDPQDHEGEILIRGENIAQESLHEKNELTPTGWLRSGDLGYLDSKNYLFITGRLKEQVNVDGYKVNPSEVEIVLAQHPSLADVGVVGLMDLNADPGEELVAAVVMKKNEKLNASELQTFCGLQLERYKIPRRFFEIQSIPRTESGKIKRNQLKKDLKSNFIEKSIKC